jgi:hypothetical protein
MSRRFDRREQIEKAALEILKTTVKPKPRWMPRRVWKFLVSMILRGAHDSLERGRFEYHPAE